MTLSQFLDNFLANIIKKRLDGVKKKVSIFMEVTKSVTSFMDFYYPLFVVTILFGCFILFWWNCPVPSWGWNGLPKKGY